MPVDPQHKHNRRVNISCIIYVHTHCNYASFIVSLHTYAWLVHGHGDPLEGEANRARLLCLPVQAMSQFTKLRMHAAALCKLSNCNALYANCQIAMRCMQIVKLQCAVCKLSNCNALYSLLQLYDRTVLTDQVLLSYANVITVYDTDGVHCCADNRLPGYIIIKNSTKWKCQINIKYTMINYNYSIQSKYSTNIYVH